MQQVFHKFGKCFIHSAERLGEIIYLLFYFYTGLAQLLYRGASWRSCSPSGVNRPPGVVDARYPQRTSVDAHSGGVRDEVSGRLDHWLCMSRSSYAENMSVFL